MLDADILHTVIPAQAGIQNLGSGLALRQDGVWIPAFAGMTGWGQDMAVAG